MPDTKAQPVTAMSTAATLRKVILSLKIIADAIVTIAGDVYSKTAATGMEDFSMVIP